MSKGKKKGKKGEQLTGLRGALRFDASHIPPISVGWGWKGPDFWGSSLMGEFGRLNSQKIFEEAWLAITDDVYYSRPLDVPVTDDVPDEEK